MDSSSALQELATRASRYSINLNGEISLIQNHSALRGGTAIVYKGTWTQGGTEVAVKTFYGTTPGDSDLKRILQEVHLWSKLRHDNVVRMLGISTEFGSTISIVSDWMPLGDAHAYVKNEENDPRPLFMDIASGLYYLHSHPLGPIFHGDLKGLNVLVSSDRRALLSDFGLSILQKSTFSMTFVSPRGGSHPWMAPELLDNCTPSTEGDVWAFGMTVLELFTRLIPFHECPRIENVMLRLVTGRLPPRPSEESTLSRMTDAWWEICTLCWKLEPSSRPSTEELMEKVKGVMYQDAYTLTGVIEPPQTTNNAIDQSGFANCHSHPCLYTVGFGNACETPITCSTAPQHFRDVHCIHNIAGHVMILCEWQNCGCTVQRQNFMRHIRGKHLGHKRG